MLPATADPIRTALSRVTFGARDIDVQTVNATGLDAWVSDQLNPPPGDDPALDAHLGAQTLHIAYKAPKPNQTKGTWDAVDEDRPLTYIYASTPELWYVAKNVNKAVAPAERTHIRKELAAATWIRNTHSAYQLREFMADFWHNHFNIGKAENQLATALLPAYDRDAIRPHVFGNFRTLLEANATSSSMLIYLDNWVSNSKTPNENYAREIMELHTLGEDAYLGVGGDGEVPLGPDGVAVGFTDQDVIEASKALSGWTIKTGQKTAPKTFLPSSGEFVYNPNQHNPWAGKILGVQVANFTGSMEQGQVFLDTIAAHPATAAFICIKLCKRIFGDNPPQAVLNRAVETWTAAANEPDQIGQVLSTIILDGDEISTAPPAKVRRPYERMIALARTTDMVVNAGNFMQRVMDPLNDGLFAWQAPNGRPDSDGHWLATGATIATWNLLLQTPYRSQIETTLAGQTPASAAGSAIGVVDYWVGRMVGYKLGDVATTALTADQAGPQGVPAAFNTNKSKKMENAVRRLTSLIAATEAFTLR
jgi:uncharacterized protein (DUF1800 family)